VRWIEGYASVLPNAEQFDLVVMTGHVFQVFLSDAEIAEALHAVTRLLATHGRFAFETRNPLVREWESWTPAETAEALDVAGMGAVAVHYDVSGVGDSIVSYETHFRFADDEVAIAPSQLRFCGHREVLAFMEEAGLAAHTVYGDWDRSVYSDASPEIIVIAGRRESRNQAAAISSA
jgi:hypothetical protein